jgi:RHS repeat-associated protein
LRLRASENSGQSWGGKRRAQGTCDTTLQFSASANRISTSGYNYDAAGNVTADGVHTYQWDAEGRVSSIDGAFNIHNALGERVYDQVPAGPLNRLYDPAGQSMGAIWSWGANYFLFFQGRMLVDFETDGAHFGHANVLGSVSQYTDWTGTTAQPILFYPWGQVWQNPTGQIGTGGPLHQVFASLPDADPSLDHYNTQFRRYSPTAGIWLSPDPLAGDISNPQSLNRYAYALNNPTSLTDPSGLCPDSNPNCPGPGRSNFGGFNDAFGYNPPCYLDYNPISCTALNQAIGAGITCIGSCSQTVTGSNGSPYQIVQTAGPTVYVGPNGEELGGGSIAELGLPQINAFGGFVTGLSNASGGTAAGCSAVLTSGGTRAGFFSNLGIYQGMASDLNTNADYIMAVSSWESGWLGTHAQELHNLFGLTNAGALNLSFPSYQASADYWSGLVVPFVSNANTMAKFIQGLKNEGYNSHAGYYDTISKQLKWVRKWEAKCVQ